MPKEPTVQELCDPAFQPLPPRSRPKKPIADLQFVHFMNIDGQEFVNAVELVAFLHAMADAEFHRNHQGHKALKDAAKRIQRAAEGKK